MMWKTATLLCCLVLTGMSFGAEKTVPQFGTTAFMAFRDLDGSFPFARPDVKDRAIYLDLMRDAGMKDLREAILQWGEIEPVRGANYDFSLTDDLVLQAGERGISILGIFTALPAWATGTSLDEVAYDMSPQDPRTHVPRREYEQDFRDFVYAAVRRYGESPDTLAGLRKPVKEWEFYNEVDAGWWQEPEAYAFWLKAFYEEVKRADPTARVVLAGLASPAIAVAGTPHKHDPSYLERLLETETLQGPSFPYFDVVNFHIYPMAYGSDPISPEVREQFISQNPRVDPASTLAGYDPLLYAMDVMTAYLRRVLQLHSLDLPVWLTEIGDNSQFTGVREQASRLVKYMVHAASLDLERVYQFCLYDLGEESGQGAWGLVRLAKPGQKPVKKPAYFAAETFLDRLEGVIKVDFLGPGVYRMTSDDGSTGFWLWRESGSEAVLPRQLGGRVQVIGIDGAERVADVRELRLTPVPVLVVPVLTSREPQR